MFYYVFFFKIQYYIPLCYILSYYIIFFIVVSYPILFYLTFNYPNLFYPTLHLTILTYPFVFNCNILFYLTLPQLSYSILSSTVDYERRPDQTMIVVNN